MDQVGDDHLIHHKKYLAFSSSSFRTQQKTDGVKCRELTAYLPIALARGRLRFRLVQVNELSARRLLEYEFIVRKRLVQVQLHDVQSNVVFLLWPSNLDLPGELYAVLLFVILVDSVGRDIALVVIEKLAMRQQIGTTENDLS